MGADIIHERSRKVALEVNFYLTHPGADGDDEDLNMSPAPPNPAAET